MELILWRHAEAEPGVDDLERKLTVKGRKQAARVAGWLNARLPSRYTLYSSPAKRALQTAKALDAPIETSELLAPDRTGADVLKAAGWPGQDVPPQGSLCNRPEIQPVSTAQMTFKGASFHGPVP